MKKTILSLILILMAMTSTNADAQKAPASAAEPVVELNTTLGQIKIKLYNDTPLHRDNFLKNVREGVYDGVLFHRVIKDFMVQAGDPTSKNATPDAMLGGGDNGYEIDAEILYPKHYHKYGALAAARTGDQVNPERKSSSTQFYIVTGRKFDEASLAASGRSAINGMRQNYFRKLVKNHAAEIEQMRKAADREGLDSLQSKLIVETEAAVPEAAVPEQIVKDYTTLGGTPHLDGQYTVYGEVIEGMDTVEKIQNAETGVADRPKEDIRIISAKVLTDK